MRTHTEFLYQGTSRGALARLHCEAYNLYVQSPYLNKKIEGKQR